jgi:hypothetical protein
VTAAHRILLVCAGRGGRRRLDRAARGPVVVSQGTVPRQFAFGRDGLRTFAVGEAALAGSAAEAIRQGAAVTF